MLVYKNEYKNGDGIAVKIVKAPKEADTKADVICLCIAKVKRGTKQYFTPDEAMSVALGLLKSVDVVMENYYKVFRKTMDL